jgi:hypothetical protein
VQELLAEILTSATPQAANPVIDSPARSVEEKHYRHQKKFTSTKEWQLLSSVDRTIGLP